MKKKLLTFVLSICFIIPCMFVFSACTQKPADIEFKVDNGYVMYYDGSRWNSLIAVEDLKGGQWEPGTPGTDADVWTIGTDGYWYKNGVKTNYKAVGEDGKKVEFRVLNGYLQWKYVDDATWTNLIQLVADVGNVTITFDSNGADINIPCQTIEKGTKITRPETPIRDGYEFLGWEYDDQGVKDLWSFTGYTIDKDITLTAKWKEDFYSEGLCFGVVGDVGSELKGNICIYDYTGNATEVIIPRTYKNKMVMEISLRAFSNNTNIKSVVIPDTIKIIDAYAFNGCSSLSIINIPESVEIIGEFIFKDCSSLKKIVLPHSVQSLGKGAFYGCSTLISVVLNMKVNTLPAYTFKDCVKLKSIDFNSYLQVIENDAFYNTKSLVSLDLPNSVKELGRIKNCDSLETISIPNTCLIIHGFSDCPKIKYTEYEDGYYLGNEDNAYHVLMEVKRYNVDDTLDINENCKVIQYGALYNTIKSVINIPASVIQLGYGKILNDANSKVENYNIDANNPIFTSIDGLIYSKDKTILVQCPRNKKGNITISANTTIIGEDAFYDCNLVDIVILPESLIEIKDYAFYYCNSLHSITIPKNVSKISPIAFMGKSLTNIVVDENNLVYDSRNNCNAIIETATNTLIFACNASKIPTNITCIGKDSFIRCSLTSIILPASITRIENYGYATAGLKTLYYYGNVSQWENVEIVNEHYFNNNVKVYYYVSNEQELPSDSGNYWHYDADGITPIAW